MWTGRKSEFEKFKVIGRRESVRFIGLGVETTWIREVSLECCLSVARKENKREKEKNHEIRER